MSIIECVVSNVLLAALLAVVAILVERIATKPQVTHALWVLVLLKLITPPMIQVPVSYAVADRLVSQSSSGSSSTVPAEQSLETAPEGPDPSPRAQRGWVYSTAVSGAKVLLLAWAAGSGIWFGLAIVRLVRFRGILRLAHLAPDDVQTQIHYIAALYGLRHIPRVLVADVKLPPLVWSFGLRPDFKDGRANDEAARTCE